MDSKTRQWYDCKTKKNYANVKENTSNGFISEESNVPGKT